MTAADTATEGTDYKATVFLPRTEFPMRGGLPAKEPLLLDRWLQADLYQRLRNQSKGREAFILHDGPPYANGHLHIGHAINKVLKDLVVRTQQMTGKNANYVPGWDCHGLPIEWMIEEKYRKEGKDKDEVAILEFRDECRRFAQKWVEQQSIEFQRLGVVGDWKTPYTTMTNAAEAQIVREIHKFGLNGGLYRGMKPVLWSVVEKTALAEAEVEYDDHVSTTIWVRFPVVTASRPSLEGASVLIWTTTPWTIPANRAVAYGEDIEYAAFKVATVEEGSAAVVGETLVLATALADDVAKMAGIAEWSAVDTFPGSALAGTVCRHPLNGKGGKDAYAHPAPALAADFVTTEQGTGVVHIAPSHGADDFELGSRHGIKAEQMVGEDGVFLDTVPLFAGHVIYKPDGKGGNANHEVCGALDKAGALLARGRLKHSYPHSWRSKAPLIFRATAQWFISMDTNDLRTTALAALDETRFVPKAGHNRLRSMIENRPDWCISRQRAWGVPIAIFVAKATGEVLRDEAVFKRIADTFEAEGSDAWFARDPQDFLGNEYRAEDYEQVFDIVDVWFESGCTHAFVLEARDDLVSPASLYLEGSDQHRGWFHSSLLESCGTRGRAPYDAVLTHGFTMDENGRKMSKSLGNSIGPEQVIKQSGADILRLWVVGIDYFEDHRIGPEILKTHVDLYRRLRNTLRYLLGALEGFAESERIADPAEMPELERWVLHRLHELDGELRQAVDGFDFHTMATALHQFCNVDLSAFYFDVRKDSLYCDRPDSVQRRAVRTVLDHLFDCLTAWLAPILCFTAEEAWLSRMGEDAGSVHERQFPEVPEAWRDDALAEKWRQIRLVRRVVTGAIELERAEKKIRSSLEAHPLVRINPTKLLQALEGVDFADIAISSDITILDSKSQDKAVFPESIRDPETGVVTEGFSLSDTEGVSVLVSKAEGAKCARCWKILSEVGSVAAHPALCGRCAEAVDAIGG